MIKVRSMTKQDLEEANIRRLAECQRGAKPDAKMQHIANCASKDIRSVRITSNAIGEIISEATDRITLEDWRIDDKRYEMEYNPLSNIIYWREKAG